MQDPMDDSHDAIPIGRCTGRYWLRRNYEPATSLPPKGLPSFDLQLQSFLVVRSPVGPVVIVRRGAAAEERSSRNRSSETCSRTASQECGTTIRRCHVKQFYCRNVVTRSVRHSCFNALATQTSIKIGQISFNVTTPSGCCLRTPPEKLHVRTEIRWHRKSFWALQPIATFALVATGDAVGAGFVPSCPLIDTRGDGRIDANEPHHAIHQLDLMKNPVEHRPAVTEIAHVTPVPR